MSKKAKKLMRHAVVGYRVTMHRGCARCHQRRVSPPAYGVERPTGLRLCEACWAAEPEDLKRKMTECHTTYRCPTRVVKGYPGGFGHTVLPPKDVLKSVPITRSRGCCSVQRS